MRLLVDGQEHVLNDVLDVAHPPEQPLGKARDAALVQGHHPLEGGAVASHEVGQQELFVPLLQAKPFPQSRFCRNSLYGLTLRPR